MECILLEDLYLFDVFLLVVEEKLSHTVCVNQF